MPLLGCLFLFAASCLIRAKEPKAPFAPVFEAVAQAVKKCACWEEGKFSVLIRREDFAGMIADVPLDVPLPDAMENAVIDALGDHAEVYVKSKSVRVPGPKEKDPKYPGEDVLRSYEDGQGRVIEVLRIISIEFVSGEKLKIGWQRGKRPGSGGGGTWVVTKDADGWKVEHDGLPYHFD